VDRQFQFGLAWRLLIVLVALFAAGILLVFAPSAYVLATRSDLSALEPAAAEFLILHRRIWPAALLSFAGLFVYALLFSHRIAGPVYRINAVLRLLLRNEYPETVRFREHDYFHPTAELLTELSRKLSGRPASPPPPEGSPERRTTDS
jgi:hypothetical protein